MWLLFTIYEYLHITEDHNVFFIVSLIPVIKILFVKCMHVIIPD